MLTKFTKRPTKLFLCAAVLSLGVGCAADEGIDAETGAEDGVVDDLALQAPSSQATTPNGNNTYFANVTANGTGCPAGTYNTSISSDGLTFTTTFSQYETSVDETQSVSAKDCQLAIKLRSPAGVSVAVSDFSYTGYAFLDRGVELRQTANYYFQGTPLRAESSRTAIVGPYDDSFLFKDTVTTADMVWSPCGLERDLNVVTRLRLRNSNNPRRTGYGNVTAVDGATATKFTIPLENISPFKLIIKLAQRRCS
jgi:hypothetical protein